MNGIFLGIVASSGGSGGGTYLALNGFYLPTASLDTWCSSSSTTVYVAVGTATSIDDAKNNNRPIYSNSTLSIKSPIGYYGDFNDPGDTGSLWEPEGSGGAGKWTVNDTQSCSLPPPQQYRQITGVYSATAGTWCSAVLSTSYVTASSAATTYEEAKNSLVAIYTDTDLITQAPSGYYGAGTLSSGYNWTGVSWTGLTANCP